MATFTIIALSISATITAGTAALALIDLIVNGWDSFTLLRVIILSALAFTAGSVALKMAQWMVLSACQTIAGAATMAM